MDTKSRPQRVNSYKLNLFVTDTAVIRSIPNPDQVNLHRVQILQISEGKFLGKWNHERQQSEANVTVTLKRAKKRHLWPKHNQMRITVGAKPLIIR